VQPARTGESTTKAELNARNWQECRRELNHGWLKNRYLLELGKFINVLEGQVIDEGWAAVFLDDLLPEWDQRRVEIDELISSFKKEMSPRGRFQAIPLVRCGLTTSQWMGELSESLWLERWPVEEWMSSSRRLRQNADEAYERLVAALAESGNLRTIEVLKCCRPRVIDFRDCCQSLATVLAEFPKEAF
jgi:hypothetical protein